MLSGLRIQCVAIAMLFSSGAAAAANFDLLKSAVQLPDGRVEIASNTAVPGQGSGAMALVIPPGLRLRDLTYLGAVVDLTDDHAGAGSPRFEITLDSNRSGHYEAADRALYLFIGTPPDFTDAPGGEQDTGNLLEPGIARCNTSELLGGRELDTWRRALQLARNQRVLRVALVVDGGFSQPDNEQTVRVAWVRLNRWVYAGGPDADQDGVLDDEDRCPQSDLRRRVDVNGDDLGETSVENFVDGVGCSIQDYVNAYAQNARSHGAYVRQIRLLSQRLLRARRISRSQAAEMQAAAAEKTPV